MPTRDVELTDEWVDIGAGPILIEAKQNNNAQIHFAQAMPTHDTRAFHDMHGPCSFSYAGRQRCWARRDGDPAYLVLTEGT